MKILISAPEPFRIFLRNPFSVSSPPPTHVIILVILKSIIFICSASSHFLKYCLPFTVIVYFPAFTSLSSSALFLPFRASFRYFFAFLFFRTTPFNFVRLHLSILKSRVLTGVWKLSPLRIFPVLACLLLN